MSLPELAVDQAVEMVVAESEWQNKKYDGEEEEEEVVAGWSV